ncbi:energy transducer TonB [Rhodanobacter sp. MP7CTX1]|uniref:energy transducer TonB n=1 Tax=Rhodanobacter sp. MP7CTX1 TaxID=2723084 RepID=UPI001609D7E8|nr:energy transducer TonB [Rhodanobacter sp. MP7CTX1]MBB6189753.1 protein TonB [Rhodanobacter sp. MP7CTX1]
MSSESLAVAHRVHPEPARIAALSAAIALNLAVIVIASRPITPAQLSVARQLTPVQLIHFIDPPAVLPAPPPVVLKPLPHPPTLATTHLHQTPTAAPVPVPSSDGQIAMPTQPTLTPAVLTHGDPVTAAPVEASLAYRLAPLQFPVQALRERIHGTVLLRVLVDETGKPLDVVVEHGSGYGLLDRSAREQVLAGWRFQPAMVQGKPVRAWARVPVSFDLREQ